MLRPQAHLFRTALPVRYNRDISMKSETQLREQLEAEGFSHTYVWQDRPNAHYSDHTHPTLTAHIVLDGEMELTTNGTTTVYKKGVVATFPPAPCTPPGWERTVAAT